MKKTKNKVKFFYPTKLLLLVLLTTILLFGIIVLNNFHQLSNQTVFATIIPVTGGNCGKTGSDVKYDLDASGNLRIYGSGEMEDYEGEDTPWFDYCEEITTVTVDTNSNVTYVGNYGFAGCTNLSTASLGSVTSVGEWVFMACESLNSVDLGYLRDIGYSMFAGCTSLSEIDLTGIESIGSNAFSYCTSLNSITIPTSVTSVDSSAFKNCTGLEEVDLGSLSTISASMFEGCSSLTSIDLSNVTSVGSSAFKNCTGLEEVDLGSLSTVSASMFEGCSSLTSIDFSDIITIGDRGFGNCDAFTQIYLDSVTSIGTYAFAGCDNLTRVDIKSIVNYFGEGIFADCFSFEKLVIWNAGNLRDISEDSYGSMGTANEEGGFDLYVPIEMVEDFRNVGGWYDENIQDYLNGLQQEEPFSNVLNIYEVSALPDYVDPSAGGDNETGVITDIVLPSIMATTLVGIIGYMAFDTVKKRKRI